MPNRQPPSGETTFRLLQQARSGDGEALEHLFARCLPLLKRWARGRLPPHARDLLETQDLVQDVLHQTFKRLDTFDARGAGAFQAYLRQAVMNRIRDELRRAGRRAQHGELDSGIPVDAPSPLEAAIGADAVERYERAMSRLPPEDRQAIILRIELGCSYARSWSRSESPAWAPLASTSSARLSGWRWRWIVANDDGWRDEFDRGLTEAARALADGAPVDWEALVHGRSLEPPGCSGSCVCFPTLLRSTVALT